MSPQIRLGRHSFTFDHLQAGDAHTVEARGWLSDVLADDIFDESEQRERHHALVDRLEAALAAQRSIGAELEANQRARIDVNGGEPPELLDGTELMRRRGEAVQRARLELFRFADLVIGEQRVRMPDWRRQLTERRAEFEAMAVEKEREAADTRALADEKAGQLAYVEAMAPLPPNRSHGVIAYDICIQPKPPPPAPQTMPRTGMEQQIVQVT
jgi:hypothetical protein